MTNLRSQLAPTWSPVNIGLAVILFLIAWPLGLAMVAYVIFGRQINLDLSRPETISAFTGRIGSAIRGFKQGWSQSSSDYHDTPMNTTHSGVPSGFSESREIDTEREALKREREMLAEERRQLAAERAANRQKVTD